MKKKWRCDVRGCKARIQTADDTIVKSTVEHSHPKEYGKEEVALVKEKIRKRGRETNNNPHVELGELTSSLSESAKSNLQRRMIESKIKITLKTIHITNSTLDRTDFPIP